MGNPLLVRCFQSTSPGLSYLSAVCRPWFNRDALHLPDLKCMKLINTLLNQGSVTVSDNPHWLRAAWKFPVSWDSIIKLQREFKLLKMGLDSPCSALEMSFLPRSTLALCNARGFGAPGHLLRSRSSACHHCGSHNLPEWGWSSLHITSRLRSPFSCFLLLLSSSESVVPSGQTVENTCVCPFSLLLWTKTQAALKAGLSHHGPGDGLGALGNLLYVQQ